jgi:hypothetical protein
MRGSHLIATAAAAVLSACAATPVTTAPTPQVSSGDVTIDSTARPDSVAPSAAVSSPAPVRDPRKHGPRRFYTGKNYGSEAEFNPLTEILNEGFDVLSLQYADRHILTRTYGIDAKNVFVSLMHPVQSFSDYGWGNLVKAELLPMSFSRSRTSGKWISNYELHLFGSGMVSLRMTDWYELHGYDHAAMLGQLTTLAAHYMNEVNENGGMRTPNEDPVVDLLIFDGAGFALWHQHWMQRDFSGRFQLTNWPGQASYDPVHRTLENTGQFFVLRGPLPLVKSWDFFYVMGESGSAGISKTIGGGRAISVGLGADGVPEVPATDSTPRIAGTTLPKATVYYDRNGSLLWSVAINNRTEMNHVAVNIYPGLLRVGGFTTGLWAQFPRSGGVKGGIISTWGVGLGGATRKAIEP